MFSFWHRASTYTPTPIVSKLLAALRETSEYHRINNSSGADCYFTGTVHGAKLSIMASHVDGEDTWYRVSDSPEFVWLESKDIEYLYNEILQVQLAQQEMSKEQLRSKWFNKLFNS
jgi:hypothetical protein